MNTFIFRNILQKSNFLLLLSSIANSPSPPTDIPVYAIDSNTIYALNDGTPIEVI